MQMSFSNTVKYVVSCAFLLTSSAAWAKKSMLQIPEVHIVSKSEHIEEAREKLVRIKQNQDGTLSIALCKIDQLESCVGEQVLKFDEVKGNLKKAIFTSYGAAGIWAFSVVFWALSIVVLGSGATVIGVGAAILALAFSVMSTYAYIAGSNEVRGMKSELEKSATESAQESLGQAEAGKPLTVTMSGSPTRIYRTLVTGSVD